MSSPHDYEHFSMPELCEVSLPGRHPGFPRMYELEEHVLAPSTIKDRGRIFVYVHDTSEKGNLDYYRFAKELTFPDGTEDAVTAAGMSFTFYTTV